MSTVLLTQVLTATPNAYSAAVDISMASGDCYSLQTSGNTATAVSCIQIALNKTLSVWTYLYTSKGNKIDTSADPNGALITFKARGFGLRVALEGSIFPPVVTAKITALGRSRK